MGASPYFGKFAPLIVSVICVFIYLFIFLTFIPLLATDLYTVFSKNTLFRKKKIMREIIISPGGKSSHSNIGTN